jgi:hypothetical protein
MNETLFLNTRPHSEAATVILGEGQPHVLVPSPPRAEDVYILQSPSSGKERVLSVGEFLTAVFEARMVHVL